MTTGNSTGGRPTQESTDPERLAWLALATIPGIGARRIAQLCAEFGSAAHVLDASDRDLSHLDWFGHRARNLLRGASHERAGKIITAAQRANQQLLVPSDIVH